MVGSSDRNPPDKNTKANFIKYPTTAKNSDKSAQATTKPGLKNNKVSDKIYSKVRQIPDTNLTLATLVCLCFNFPLGAIAMYLSLTAAKAYRDGNSDRGEFRAKASVLLSLFSIVSTVLIVMSIVLWIVVEAQSKRELRDNT